MDPPVSIHLPALRLQVCATKPRGMNSGPHENTLPTEPPPQLPTRIISRTSPIFKTKSCFLYKALSFELETHKLTEY